MRALGKASIGGFVVFVATVVGLSLYRVVAYSSADLTAFGLLAGGAVVGTVGVVLAEVLDA